MKLTKKQKLFLETIPNKKDRKNQRQQFKLQNKFDKFGSVEEIIFIDGIFKTDNPELIALFNECPMVGKVEENSLSKTLRDLTEPKTDNENIQKEFCVEITEENKEVLEKLWNYFHKGRVSVLNIGYFINSNSLFTHCYQSNVSTGEENKQLPIVSTEEFLRYVGKEECYKISTPIGNIVTEPKKEVLDKPLEFDLPKKENPIQDIECLNINDVIYSGVLVLTSTLCQNLKNYLIDIVEKKTNPLNL